MQHPHHALQTTLEDSLCNPSGEMPTTADTEEGLEADFPQHRHLLRQSDGAQEP